MRIYKLIGCGIVALAAIVGVNAHVASVGLSSSSLNVSNVENVAEGWEWDGWSNFFGSNDSLKDEQPYTGECRVPYSSTSSYGGSYSSTGQVVYYYIDCWQGNTDCVPQSCQHP